VKYPKNIYGLIYSESNKKKQIDHIIHIVLDIWISYIDHMRPFNNL